MRSRADERKGGDRDEEEERDEDDEDFAGERNTVIETIREMCEEEEIVDATVAGTGVSAGVEAVSSSSSAALPVPLPLPVAEGGGDNA